MTLTAVDSIFAVVYVKDVYLAHVYLVRCWRWPCPHGVRNWNLKDCPLKMASNLCWIYDLPMTYSYFAQHWTKRAFCWMSWLPASLARVGLTLNLKKTKILTTQVQPPQQLQTRGGVTVDVLDHASSHKWLGCLLHTGGCHDADIDFHLQAALRAFNANLWILIDRHVSFATRLRYFDTIITPVACFAAGHRTILKKDLNKIDVTFRKLLRSVVGPPAATDWSRPWHEIMHDWNARVVQFVEQYSVKHWSMRCLEMHWKLAHHAANLPPDRWLARILTWTCRGHQNTGRPRNTWDTMIQKFGRYQQLGNWLDVARDANRWSNLMPHFVTFCTQT